MKKITIHKVKSQFTKTKLEFFIMFLVWLQICSTIHIQIIITLRTGGGGLI